MYNVAKFYLEIKRKKITVEGVMSGLSLVEDLESLTIKYLGMQLKSLTYICTYCMKNDSYTF